MLITRPNHDITTNYLYYWSKPLIDFAQKKGHRVIDLPGKRANKAELLSVLRKTRPRFIVLNGHGRDDAIAGQDNDILVDAKENPSVLSGAVVYARSCSSAKALGPECVSEGTIAYIGYTDEFVFFVEEAYTSRPWKDKTAERFLASSNQVVLLLLKGHSAGEAHRKTRQAYRREIKNLMTSDTPKEEREFIPYLRWNMIHQVCLGDEGASLGKG